MLGVTVLRRFGDVTFLLTIPSANVLPPRAFLHGMYAIATRGRLSIDGVNRRSLNKIM